jgi:phenylacetate-CoA ligase
MTQSKEILQTQFAQRLAQDKKDLEDFLSTAEDRFAINPKDVPAMIWGNTYWDFMPADDRDRILAGMFRHTLTRAQTHMPIYQSSDAFKKIKPADFATMADLLELPFLSKDGENGFRAKVFTKPELLRPTDITATLTPYLSGGTGIDEETEGKATPTWISENDLDLESRALAFRCFLPGGFNTETKIMNIYNLAHKGGEEIRRAVSVHIGVHTNIPRRPEENIHLVLANIKKYRINTIAAVPASPTTRSGAPKGGAVSFQSIYSESPKIFGTKYETGEEGEGLVDTAFVTGFALTKEIIKIAERNGMRLFTTWGASEAIPGATSTVIGPEERLCKYNSQHLTYGPHMLTVVDVKGDKPRFCRPGEEGLLLVTTIAREGTIFVNYMIGDKAKIEAEQCPCGRTTPIISGIRREDNKAEFASGGCRYV